MKITVLRALANSFECYIISDIYGIMLIATFDVKEIFVPMVWNKMDLGSIFIFLCCYDIHLHVYPSFFSYILNIHAQYSFMYNIDSKAITDVS